MVKPSAEAFYLFDTLDGGLGDLLLGALLSLAEVLAFSARLAFLLLFLEPDIDDLLF